jgi:hypothetical protein
MRGAASGVSGAAANTVERGREAFADAGSAIGGGARAAGRAGAAAGRSAAQWVVPVLALLALALGVWWWRASHPREPVRAAQTGTGQVNREDGARLASDTLAGAADTAATTSSKVTTQLTDFFKSATDTVGQIKDPASADAAIPKLRELGDKLDAVKKMTATLPTDARAKLTPMITDARTALDAAVQKVSAIPGVGDKIKPVVEELTKKLSEITG